MKLLILCVLLSLASGNDSKKIALTIKMTEVSSAIPDSVSRTIAEVLPNLVIQFLPSEVPPVLGNLLQEVSVDATYDSVSKTANVTLYFLQVPAAFFSIIESQLPAVLSSASVSDVLTGVLPYFLMCDDGQCSYAGAFFHLADTAPEPVVVNAPHHVNTIGLELKIVGASQAIPAEKITTATANLPNLLASNLNQLSPALAPLVLKAITGFLKEVRISQGFKSTQSTLFVNITFPAIPSSYIEMYKPLFSKYVIDNAVISGLIKAYVSNELAGCTTGCSIGHYQLYDVITEVTNAPTAVTPAPFTNAPTNAPVTTAPTNAPVTTAPTAFTNAPVTTAPTSAPVTYSPTSAPTAADDSSSASPFAPVNALFVVLGVIAIVL